MNAALELQKWIKRQDLEVSEFAATIDLHKQTVYNWLNGKYKPTKHFRAIIRNATNGKIKPEDWDE